MMKRLVPTRSAASAIALCAALLLASHPASPQTAPSSTDLQGTLERLSAVAQSLKQSLPSITCTETGVSEVFKDGKRKRHVEFAASLRAIRVPGAGLHEFFNLTQINGKPHSKPGYNFPYFASEGFDSALIYFLPRSQPCYVYTLSSGRIDFVTADDAASRPPCRAEGVRGFALLDADGNVTHIERTVPESSSRDFHLVTFAAIDLAPVELNGHNYRLSRHIVTESSPGDVIGHFEATYSGCKLFTASVTILPPTQVVPDTAPPPQ
jgi:hypothetical protein